MIFFLKLLLQMLLKINNISLIFKILFNKILIKWIEIIIINKFFNKVYLFWLKLFIVLLFNKTYLFSQLFVL